MPDDPTRLSKLSIGWRDSTETIGDENANDAGSAVFSLGYPGAPITQVSTHTFESDLGTVTAHDASVVTVGISGATRGDTFLLDMDSEFSGVGGGDHNVNVFAQSGDTTGEVNVIAQNSAASDVDTSVSVFRITRISYTNYI